MTKPKTNSKINGKDYFRIRRTIGGKTKSFYGRTRAEAEKKCSLYIESMATDAVKTSQKPIRATLGEMASNYIKTTLSRSQKYATATRDRYEMAYNTHVKSSWISRMEVDRIRASDMQRFYNELQVSRQTLASVNKFMSGFNKWLILNGYAEDFLAAVELPVKPENKRHEGILIWEDDEIQKILSCLDNHRLRFFVYTMLYTGARMSETIALTHSDMANGSVRINKQNYCGELKPPKYNSSRDVPIHTELWKEYQKHIRWQQRDMEKHNYETDLLFTTSNGRMYDPKSVRVSLQRLYDANGIPRKSPHTYRATFCTQLCRCGVPLEVASRLMGHKSIEVTSKHYALVKTESKQEAIATLKY